VVKMSKSQTNGYGSIISLSKLGKPTFGYVSQKQLCGIGKKCFQNRQIVDEIRLCGCFGGYLIES
jgi:hypothetical protein